MKKKRAPTFAEIVAEERAKPVPEPEPRRPGMYGREGELVGPDGTVYAYAADASREWLAPEAIRGGIPERDRTYDWPNP